jgi:hypothetical protein
MSGDLTLDDLAGGGDDSGGSSGGSGGKSGSDGDGGESFTELLKFLDERGYLGPLMFGDTNANGGDAPAPEANADLESASDGDLALNAANIERFGKMVQGQFGDVPLSRVISFAENNPDRVNEAIRQMGEQDGGD